MDDDLSSLHVVNISDMANLKELPRRLRELEGFKEMDFKRCDNLVRIPELTRSINIMEVEDCPSLVSLPSNVKHFVVTNCTKLKFPTESCNTSLESLEVVNADDSLNDISLGIYPKLLSLQISYRECLKVTPKIQNHMLYYLSLYKCESLLCFPKGGFEAPNLEVLNVEECKKLKSLPEQMHSLNPCLKELCVENCIEIESFPQGGLPLSLEVLEVSSCEKLTKSQSNWGLKKLPEESLLPCSLAHIPYIEIEGVLISLINIYGDSMLIRNIATRLIGPKQKRRRI